MTYTIKLSNSLHQIRPEELISDAGATAKIYSISGTDTHVFKEYNDKKTALKMQSKVEHFIKNSPPDYLIEDNTLGETLHLLAWPKQSVFKKDKFVGFVMPRINFDKTVQINRLFTIKNRQKDNFPEDIIWRILVARNLANIYSELHKLGYYVVDTKPANLRTYKHLQGVCVLDCDGFALKGSPFDGEMITPDYIAPESIGVPSSKLGREQDIFALSVLIFQLFNNGIHPYSGVLKDKDTHMDLQSRIKLNAYSYGLFENEVQDPSPWSLHHLFPNKLTEMFSRVFEHGERPDALEWVSLLESLNDGRSLANCSKSLHGKTFRKGCGACELDKLIASSQLSKNKTNNSDAVSSPWSKTKIIPASPPPPKKDNSFLWISSIAIILIMILGLFSSNQNNTSVSNTTVTSSNQYSCNNNPESCSNQQLCQMATISNGGITKWETRSNFIPFVQAAQRRGLKCRVQNVQPRNNSWDNLNLSYVKRSNEWILEKNLCAVSINLYSAPFSKLLFGYGNRKFGLYMKTNLAFPTEGPVNLIFDSGKNINTNYKMVNGNNYMGIAFDEAQTEFKNSSGFLIKIKNGSYYKISLSGSKNAINRLNQRKCTTK